MQHRPSKEPFSITKAHLDSAAAAAPGSPSLVDQIFMVIAGAIQCRRLSPGERVPAIRQVAEDCEVSRDTASRAYDKLVAHGLLTSRRGAGFYVRASSSQKTDGRQGPAGRAGPKGIGFKTRFLLSMLHPPQALKSRSGVGYLPEGWMNEAEISGALREIARSSQRTLALPGDPQGYLPLRGQLQLKLHDIGVQTVPENIVVTSGAMEAISLITHAFANSPSETILIESPRQPILDDRLLSFGTQIAYVPRMADGPNVAVLRQLCEKRRPRVFFCQSLVHNPTGGSIAPHVAFEILRIAEEYDLTIVEDDSYGDLLPTASIAETSRLASLDQLRRVIYVGGFSKTLAPGLRVGFIAANPERIKWLGTYRAIHNIAGNTLGERVVYRMLSGGQYRHHCEQIRGRLGELRPPVLEAVREAGFTVSFEPDAGMFIWANLGQGVNAFSVAQRLLEQGHLIAPGNLFSPTETSHIRLNVAETLGTGVLETIKKLIG